MNYEISNIEKDKFLKTLKKRFEENMNRHTKLEWVTVEARLNANPKKLMSLYEMEKTGGEPDVVEFDVGTQTFTFYDCSKESPKGRRGLCYDRAALEARKKYPPKSSVEDIVNEMGVELMTEMAYRYLQQLGNFDTKTSSWLKTPSNIRELGGAIFGDFRYGSVFIYHNGADSYYAARGFRAMLSV